MFRTRQASPPNLSPTPISANSPPSTTRNYSGSPRIRAAFNPRRETILEMAVAQMCANNLSPFLSFGYRSNGNSPLSRRETRVSLSERRLHVKAPAQSRFLFTAGNVYIHIYIQLDGERPLDRSPFLSTFPLLIFNVAPGPLSF